MPAGSQHPEELANQPSLVGFGDADVAGSLQADDRVEGCVREIESPRVPSLNDHAIGETTVGNQLTCLAHLLAADVHSRDATAAPPGDSQRWGTEAATHVQHTRGALEPRQ